MSYVVGRESVCGESLICPTRLAGRLSAVSL